MKVKAYDDWWPETPYIVLGLPETCSLADVKRARKLGASEHHPDAGGSTRRMARINAAVDVLERERAALDAFLAVKRRATARPSPAPKPRAKARAREAPRSEPAATATLRAEVLALKRENDHLQKVLAQVMSANAAAMKLLASLPGKRVLAFKEKKSPTSCIFSLNATDARTFPLTEGRDWGHVLPGIIWVADNLPHGAVVRGNFR